MSPHLEELKWSSSWMRCLLHAQVYGQFQLSQQQGRRTGGGGGSAVATAGYPGTAMDGYPAATAVCSLCLHPAGVRSRCNWRSDKSITVICGRRATRAPSLHPCGLAAAAMAVVAIGELVPDGVMGGIQVRSLVVDAEATGSKWP